MPHDSDELLQRLRATFRLEAAEHCESMSAALLELESAPEETRRALIERTFRSAHSLKGAARAVSNPAVEAICQGLESVFDAWKRRTLAPAPASFDVLHRAIERARALAESPEYGAETKELTPLIRELEALVRGGPGPSSPVATRGSGLPATPSAPVAPSFTATSLPSRAKSDAPVAETIRVATEKVERTLYATEELLAMKSALGQRIAELREAAALLERSHREWTSVQEAARRDLSPANAPSESGSAGRAEAALPQRIERSREMERTAEEKLRILIRGLSHDRHAFTKTVDSLLDETKKLLLLPFATDAAFYSKLVRDLARDQGKQVEFVVRGGEVELDKRILEGIKDALVHLLRNAIDHGMEKPETRIARGKPARGQVTLAASRIDDHKVEILIADDGAGIDVAALRKTIVRRGFAAESAARELSDEEVLAFIFRAEVSTAPMVTEVSGRGVGLAIVQEVADRLNGRVAVHSQTGKGTSFRLVLPAAQNTFRGVLVAVAEQVFVLPALRVQRVHRAASVDIKTVENRATLTVEGRPIALAWLHDILDLPRRSEAAEKFVETVVIGSPDRAVAFVVDAILGEEELLVKPLRKPLVRVRNIAGAAVLGSGRVALILNGADLVDSAATTAGPRAAEAIAKPEAKRRSILVAEDSITSRMLLKNILESAGYTVRTAVDGLDAITLLRSEKFDLVISDVEMPRMNGFGLTTAIRGDRRLAEIPVILVTALAKREDRERGIDVGANAYLVKGDLDQSNLLETVQRFL